MRIGIICNGLTLSLWQRRAIDKIAAGNELFLLVTENRRPEKRKLKWAAYYALNLVTIRNRLTRAVPFPEPSLAIADTLRFECDYDGNWAVLPDSVLAWVRERGIDVILKFGLNLLRIPDGDRLCAPILSYHHGDPRAFRGRPAGFYELLGGAPFMGQIVQILSNKLDAGAVLAFAQTRVIRHSYRQTLLEAYGLSPHLLPKALAALRRGQTLPIDPIGRNYRLPANATVLKMLLRIGARAIRHFAYGAFIEKQWRVATLAPCDAVEPVAAVRQAGSVPERWSVPELLPGYTFYADGFFHEGSNDLLVEAMNGKTGRGELVRIGDGRQVRLGGFAGHVSYPASVEEEGRRYIVPEVVDWSPPTVFSLQGGAARRVAVLDIGEKAILDPTLFRHEGQLYLFGNRPADGTSLLHLWSAPSLFGRFELHPASPIRVSARGSRMAGEITVSSAGLFRPGQDFRSGYGDGVLSFRIETLTPLDYREVEVGEAAFAHVRGPHTINLRDGVALFDFYTERRSLLAGVRRLLNRLAREPLPGQAVEKAR